MKALNHFTQFRRTDLIANVIECDAYQLSLKGENNAPIYLSIAFHVNSKDVLGWRITHQPPGYRSTLQALEASLHGSKLGERTKPCYVISDLADGRAVEQALRHTGVQVQIRAAWAPSDVAHAERFFRVLQLTFTEKLHLKSGDAAPATIRLNKLRKLFEAWLFKYHQIPAVHRTRVQDFAYMHSREIPRSHVVEHEPSAAGQPTPAPHRHSAEGKRAGPNIFRLRRSIRRVRPDPDLSIEALKPGHPIKPENGDPLP
ncbi:hypothetical protein PS712_03341 [Pseudomonas fluorescens]|uniref:Integrase catalytic domain-containing protein n=1 Tax=Pseudomonas fluorescens TaxID=294 RepID=A0A5E7CWI4_PSEFL|nr:transposase family protein [Pseudomonas fluorescens]VVO09519.1 hypothetical protein PS712_03341 [Pseudomonas fluorescens]